MLLQKALTGALLLSALSPVLHSAHAEGLERGGGSGVQLADGSVVLADPFAKRLGGKRLKFAPELVSELRLAGHILTTFGARIPAPYASLLKSNDDRSWYRRKFNAESVVIAPNWDGMVLRPSEFVEKYVLSSRVDYRVDEELPKHCTGKLIEADPKLLPSAGVASGPFVVACTHRNLTIFKKSMIERMPLRELALLIVHERLHALPDGAPYEHLYLVTRGLGVALRLVDEQIKGARPVVTDAERALLTEITDGIWYLEIGLEGYPSLQDWHDLWEVWPLGGGVVRRKIKITPTVYVGAGSLLGDEVGPVIEADAGAAIILSAIDTVTLRLKKDALVQASWIDSFGRNTVYELGEKSRVFGSTLLLSPPVIGPGSELIIAWGKVADDGPSGLVRLDANAEISRSLLTGPIKRLLLGEKSAIRSSRMGFEAGLYTDTTALRRLLNPMSIFIGRESTITGVGSLLVIPEPGETEPNLAVGAELAFDFGGDALWCDEPEEFGNIILDFQEAIIRQQRENVRLSGLVRISALADFDRLCFRTSKKLQRVKPKPEAPRK